MAKIVIAGDAVVITSAMKFEDIRTINKYRPEALILKGGEDGKEPIFAVGVTNGEGAINNYGVSFNGVTRDDKRLATLTMVTQGIEGDIKEFVVDKVGSALIHLNKLEATLPGVLSAIADERSTLMNDISIAQ